MALLCLAGALAPGCAGLTQPPERPYRAFGVARTTALLGSEDGSRSYVVHLEERVEYNVQVAEAAGVVRLRTIIRNSGREPVRYELERAVLAAADGALLRAAGGEEQPGSKPTDLERTSEDHIRGVRVIAPGELYAITRRYVLVDGLRHGRDLLLLARLSLGDEVRVGGRVVPVALRLEQVR
jgi:hypothetical protein